MPYLLILSAHFTLTEYDDPLEAYLLNNKNPELVFDHNRFEDQDINSTYLRATALENSNIGREMLAKDGPPPSSPSFHGDHDGDNDNDGEGGGNDYDGWQEGPVHHGPASDHDDNYDEKAFNDEDHEDYGDLTSHEDDGVGDSDVEDYESPEAVEECGAHADHESTEDEQRDYDVSREGSHEHGTLTVPAIDSEVLQSSSYDAWAAYAELLERFNAF